MRSQIFTVFMLLLGLLSGRASCAQPAAAKTQPAAAETEPAAAETGPAVARYHIDRSLVYVERDQKPLRADVYVPNSELPNVVGPYPGVLVVHGGAWMAGRRTQLASVAKKLAEAGYTAVAISYRLAPRHPFPAQIDDCKAAVRWMRQNAEQLSIDPRRIGGFGYSAGGHLVALLGTAGEPGDTNTRIQAYVAGAAPCDFRIMPPNVTTLSYWLGGTRHEKPSLYEQASPAHFVSADDPPAFFYHGTRDTVVPMISSTAMVVALRQVGVSAELHQVAGVGHIRALFNPQAIQAAIRFLDQHLRDDNPSLDNTGRKRPR